ncbi:hypothetical protein TIFTF001_015615 [Ficus carica]|uniref:C2 domain-containing protein n=1 Tax=Ficus carica TaxID=3494 RepID=A0AA88A5Z3_FICCA|nr:hypothetical protein TIFTF001_015615 [Ficus carica]
MENTIICQQKAKTNVHRGSGTNPTWNFPVTFTVDKSLAQNNRLTLVIKLVCDRSLGDKDIGEVNIPVKELLASMDDGNNNNNNNSMKFVSYQVRKPSGKAKGELHFSYKFDEKVAGKPAADKPVRTYSAVPAVGPSYPPPPPVGYDHVQPPPPVMGYAGGYPPPPAPVPAPYGGVGYPPPPPGYGYPPPPPPPHPGYGYPPAPGYGYPPPQQVPQPQKSQNKFGMGLGAGLLGGALGGLLIGDMVSDASAYDAGYDAGFDDAGGFYF